jgi:hypothetical protein
VTRVPGSARDGVFTRCRTDLFERVGFGDRHRLTVRGLENATTSHGSLLTDAVERLGLVGAVGKDPVGPYSRHDFTLSALGPRVSDAVCCN